MTQFEINYLKKKSSSAANGSNSRKPYRQYSNSAVIDATLRLYQTDPLVMTERKFCASVGLPRSTFATYFGDSGLKEMKVNNEPLAAAKDAITAYLDKLTKQKVQNAGKLHESCRYMTDNEELSVVQICRMLAAMGHGVTRPEVLSVINNYLLRDVDERIKEEASMKTVRNMINRHSDLAKIVNACSIDPKRAQSANKETRDAVFTKLENYTETLYAMGKIPWKRFCDVPKERIYNMDEVSNDTTKHRKKIIADNSSAARVFTITPEGDGKMDKHITMCITSRADGKSFENLFT
jgi:hypothetical protein